LGQSHHSPLPSFLDLSTDILEHVDPIFFGDAKTAAMKVMGLV
jgi:ATP-dependent Lon protease